MLLGILHILLWLFFRSLVTDKVKDVSIEAGEGGEFTNPGPADDFPAGEKKDEFASFPSYGTSYGTGGGNLPPAEYRVAQPYRNEDLVVADTPNAGPQYGNNQYQYEEDEDFNPPNKYTAI